MDSITFLIYYTLNTLFLLRSQDHRVIKFTISSCALILAVDDCRIMVLIIVDQILAQVDLQRLQTRINQL